MGAVFAVDRHKRTSSALADELNARTSAGRTAIDRLVCAHGASATKRGVWSTTRRGTRTNAALATARLSASLRRTTRCIIPPPSDCDAWLPSDFRNVVSCGSFDQQSVCRCGPPDVSAIEADTSAPPQRIRSCRVHQNIHETVFRRTSTGELENGTTRVLPPSPPAEYRAITMRQQQQRFRCGSLFWMALVLLAALPLLRAESCCPNLCSGHGTCATTGNGCVCTCFKGFLGGDCSRRESCVPSKRAASAQRY